MNILYYDELPSSNDKLRELAENGAGHGTVVIAGAQTRGKGRMGRSWDSPRGDGLYLSILSKPRHKIKRPALLSLVTGLAVCKTVEFFVPGDVKIKWPNDVLLNRRKLSGILVESVVNSTDVGFFITGIGINVNNKGFYGGLEIKATSLYIESGNKFTVRDIADRLISELEIWHERFFSGDISCLEEYRKRCINIGQEVRLIYEDSELLGEATGINDDGELLVKTKAGDVIRVNSGEVSVRSVESF